MIRFDHPDLRLDAPQSLNLRRALEHVRSRTYDVEFAALKGRSFLPTDNEVNTGDESVAFDTYENVGEAAFTTDYATDAPSAGVKASSEAQLIRGMQTHYGYSLQELRAAAKSGSGLVERKAVAARRAIEQLHDTTMLLGDTAWGLKGLFTLNTSLTYTIATGAAGTLWTAKTPDEILADMFGMENKIIETTLEVENPNTLILPLTAYNYIKTKRMGDGIDGTVLQFFLANATSITSVETSTKLQSNSGWTGRRMIAYDRSPETQVYVEPQPFEQLSPQVDGARTKIICLSRTAGVQVFRPKSIVYGDTF
jgi:hypothetical protein